MRLSKCEESALGIRLLLGRKDRQLLVEPGMRLLHFKKLRDVQIKNPSRVRKGPPEKTDSFYQSSK
jgi:hypothetical protein